jgi:Ser/Thr protein kinase RdoA (MazF antagonist)
MAAATDFYQTTPAEQVERLAALARIALDEWGLGSSAVNSVAYRENMTFRVDTPEGTSFALRVHQGSYRTDAQISSELQFMTYLESQGISTPRVVPTKDGALFTTISAPGVLEPRQCDLFEWIEGKPLRMTGMPVSDPAALTESYVEVGRLAARIYNATENWQKPDGFTRPAWDAEGIFGVNGNIGDFRRLTGVPHDQMRRLLAVADKLDALLEEFGKSPDRYGLSHGDFLGENIFLCEGGIRLLDFDDAGESWHMLDIITALFDLRDTPAFEPCLEALVRGYREYRDLPDDHLQLLPAFFLARLLSYLGWCAKKPHMPQATVFKPMLLAAFEQHAPAFLAA